MENRIHLTHDVEQPNTAGMAMTSNLRIAVRGTTLATHVYRAMPELVRFHVRFELAKVAALYDRLSRKTPSLPELIESFQGQTFYHNAFLYAFCRQFKPDIVVETGVYYGIGSAFILKALADNGRGHLYSIDLPGGSYKQENSAVMVTTLLPRKKPTGFAVPRNLRGRWTLILGDAKTELPLLMDRLDFIDIFYHDSMHVYDHMYFEYETAWKKLRPGCLLMSDDVEWNSAFLNFCGEKRVDAHVTNGIGFAVK
jgi:hypothetical protein